MTRALSANEIAVVMGVSRKTVAKWRASYGMPAVGYKPTVGRPGYRSEPEAVRQWLEIRSWSGVERRARAALDVYLGREQPVRLLPNPADRTALIR